MKLLNYPSDINQPEKPLVAEQDTIRILIGLLGFLLPILLWTGLYGYTGHTRPLSSISHYFYSRMNSAFIITLGVLAVVLLVYKGKKTEDFWLSTAAGVFALGVVLLPTNVGYPDVGQLPTYYVTFIQDNPLRNTVHFVSAAIFLGCLAVMSFWRFPQANSSDEQPKPLDRFMYRFCGVVMLLSMLVILLGINGILLSEEWFNRHQGIFWGEAVAVWAFGYSWLLKAGFFSKTVALFTGDAHQGAVA